MQKVSPLKRGDNVVNQTMYDGFGITNHELKLS